VIIGEKKCGTTSLYHLLTRHPHVEPAALKEPHYFVEHFDDGIEWYRRCFPPPTWKGGRRSITGEATPKYLSHPIVPERMAEVVPQARLIALLRNPVDRAYSDYQQMVRKGLEPRTFEEAVEAQKKSLPFVKEDETLEHEERASLDDDALYNEYLSRGTYVDYFEPRNRRLYEYLGVDFGW
jgi:lipopolysaccharide transport system ATP-binding protein